MNSTDPNSPDKATEEQATSFVSHGLFVTGSDRSQTWISGDELLDLIEARFSKNDGGTLFKAIRIVLADERAYLRGEVEKLSQRLAKLESKA